MNLEAKKETKEPRADEPLMNHEYDGIRELDHKMPNWWLAIFYLSIVFSFAYWAYYHILEAGPLQMEEYAIEMARAEAAAEARAADRGALTDEHLLAMAEDEARVAGGQQTFGEFCAACHGPDGSGGIGSNLTDAYWIHGGSPLEIYQVVAEGVATAGMPAWKGVLGASKTEEVAAYVLTLAGKDLPGKAPEGEKLED